MSLADQEALEEEQLRLAIENSLADLRVQSNPEPPNGFASQDLAFFTDFAIPLRSNETNGKGTGDVTGSQVLDLPPPTSHSENGKEMVAQPPRPSTLTGAGTFAQPSSVRDKTKTDKGGMFAQPSVGGVHNGTRASAHPSASATVGRSQPKSSSGGLFDKISSLLSEKPSSRASSDSGAKGPHPDEGDLCRACLQPCSNSVFSSFSTIRAANNDLYHADCFICGTCRNPIRGQYLQHSSSQYPYHPGCFRCGGCDLPINGNFKDLGDPPQAYHAECYKELYHPRCCLCTHTLEGQFYKHPFFESEMYCMSHESLPSCFACARKQPLPASRREGFADLMDGRSLCAQCSGSIIVDSSEAVALYKGIVEFMGRDLGLSIPPGMQEVPILLVDFQSLNENRNKFGEVLGYHSDAQAQVASVDSTPSTSPSKMPSMKPVIGSAPPPPALLTPVRRAALGQQHTEGIIRGVTMSTCAQVRYLPSAGLQFDAAGKGLAARLPAPEVYQMKQVRDVTAVLVLYGLPRDLTASILAHEAMHVWLKLNKAFPFRLPPKVEEGLCQVIAHTYLEHLVKRAAAESAGNAAPAAVSSSVKLSYSSSAAVLAPPSAPLRPSPAKRPTSVSLKPKPKPKDKTLTKWFSEQIEVDKSPIYGKGFEEAHRAVSVLGLPAVLSYIQRHQCLPPLHN